MNMAHLLFPAFRRFLPLRGFFCLVSLLACCALSASATTAQVLRQKLVPAIQMEAATPMLPYLDWLLDPGGRFSVEEVAMPERQALFRPLNPDTLPYESGTVWLRFMLTPRPLESRPSTLLLDLGEGVPGTPTLYVPKHTMTPGVTEWQEFTPSQRAVFLMPDAQSTSVTAYIKMDGLPGIWFDPILRTPHNAATAFERLARPAVIVALAVVMLLCLLRGLSERGEWRIWTGCYTGAALLHAVWGAPATPHGHVAMADVASVLAPGVALMLLPHVGRHLMHTRTRARVYDIQYFILTLPGALLALVPLLPGFSWTARFLALWPLGTLLLVPTTVGAWLSGLPGARRFLLGCLAPAVGTALGLIGIGSPVPEPLLATAPLWGLALGALIIAGTATSRDQLEDEALSQSDGVAEVPAAPPLRILEEPSEGEMVLPVGDTVSVRPPTAAADPQGTENQALALEKRLRGPLDVLLREGTALGECSLPPAARQHAEAMVNAVRSMAVTLADPVYPEAPPAAMDKGQQVFDLQQMLREAHDNVTVSAENKNIALSWFMPPYLPQRYEGDGTRLSQVLRMLLESSVRATSRGAVQLAVRRVPESVDPGHLLFTITDTGDGVPPAERSSLALARAWELAGAHKGFLGVESSPQGASVSFTVRLGVHQADVSVDPPENPVEQCAPQGVIIADENPGNRQLLAFFLEGLPYRTREARTAEEAAELFMQAPAALLIFDGDMFAEQTLSAVSRIRACEQERGGPQAYILALTEDDSMWDDLHKAGFTHALTKPVTRTGLRRTVLELLPPAGASSHTDEPAEGLPPLNISPPLTAPQEEDEVVDTGLPLPASDAMVRETPPATPEQPLRIPSVAREVRELLRSADSVPPTPVPKSSLQVEPSVRIPAPTAVPQDPMEDLLTDLFGPEEPAARPAGALMASEPLRMTPTEKGRATPAVTPEPAAPQHFEPLSFGSAEDGVRIVSDPHPISAMGSPARPSAAPSAVGEPQEWVGDPVPPASQVSSVPPAPPVSAPRPSTVREVEQGVEWVGEPVPVPKTAPAPSGRSEEPAVSSQSISVGTPSPRATSDVPGMLRAAPGMRPTPQPAPRPAPAVEQEPPFIPLTLDPSPQEAAGQMPGRQSAGVPPVSAPRPQTRGIAPTVRPVTQPAASPAGSRGDRPTPQTEQATVSRSGGSATAPEMRPAATPPPVSEENGPLPPIAGLLVVLDAAMFDARTAFAQGDPPGVQAAAGRIASHADSCGLRVLARMARCVEGAAKARDRDALTYLLPELETAVERNRIALMPKNSQ